MCLRCCTQGDQASIIGGAIDFVKELEQRLLSLRTQKRLLESAAVRSRPNDDEPRHTSVLHDGFFISPQYTGYSRSQQGRRDANGEEAQQEDGTGVDVEATVVQGHVNLKVAAQRRRGQLVRAIAAMEELRLSVLHLNVASLEPSSVLYSLSLKVGSPSAPRVVCHVRRRERELMTSLFLRSADGGSVQVGVSGGGCDGGAPDLQLHQRLLLTRCWSCQDVRDARESERKGSKRCLTGPRLLSLNYEEERSSGSSSSRSSFPFF